MRSIAVILLLIISLSGCLTKKQAVKRLAIINDKFPELILAHCATNYPVKELTRIETRYIQGKDSIITDTVFVDCTEKENRDNRAVIVPVPKTVYRTDTIKLTETITVENTAKVTLLNNEVTALKAAKTELINDKKRLRKQVYVLYIITFILSSFCIIKLIK